MKKKALILLSGGLDSATVAAIAKQLGYELFALSFSYGQKHEIELQSMKKIIKFFSIEQSIIINIDPGIFKNSALIDKNMTIPKDRNIEDEIIPSTYVPARNIIFLSYALAFSESHNIGDIFIGANHIDYSGYPDCRPEFLDSFAKMANIGTKFGQNNSIRIQAPLLNLSKGEIIKKGLELKVDYSITHSCYDPDITGLSCGSCDSCLIRLAGFKENAVIDPIKYIL